MQNQANNLTRRLLIRKSPDYAAQQVDAIFDEAIDGITADLPKYAAAIQAELPQLWPWLVERAQTSAILRPAIDETCFKAFDKHVDGHLWLTAVINLYLADHPQLSALYDLAIEKAFEGVSDGELERIIEATHHE